MRSKERQPKSKYQIIEEIHALTGKYDPGEPYMTNVIMRIRLLLDELEPEEAQS